MNATLEELGMANVDLARVFMVEPKTISAWKKTSPPQAVTLLLNVIERYSLESRRHPFAILGEAMDKKLCPECGHVFDGNGWDGIEAHWRTRHAGIVSFAIAWPIVQRGQQPSQVLRSLAMIDP